MVEAAHPHPRPRPAPVHPVVEGAGAEQRRERDRVDREGEALAAARREVDEQPAGEQRDRERVLVDDAAEPRLDLLLELDRRGLGGLDALAGGRLRGVDALAGRLAGGVDPPADRLACGARPLAARLRRLPHPVGHDPIIAPPASGHNTPPIRFRKRGRMTGAGRAEPVKCGVSRGPVRTPFLPVCGKPRNPVRSRPYPPLRTLSGTRRGTFAGLVTSDSIATILRYHLKAFRGEKR